MHHKNEIFCISDRLQSKISLSLSQNATLININETVRQSVHAYLILSRAYCGPKKKWRGEGNESKFQQTEWGSVPGVEGCLLSSIFFVVKYLRESSLAVLSIIGIRRAQKYNPYVFQTHLCCYRALRGPIHSGNNSTRFLKSTANFRKALRYCHWIRGVGGEGWTEDFENCEVWRKRINGC